MNEVMLYSKLNLLRDTIESNTIAVRAQIDITKELIDSFNRASGSVPFDPDEEDVSNESENEEIDFAAKVPRGMNYTLADLNKKADEYMASNIPRILRELFENDKKREIENNRSTEFRVNFTDLEPFKSLIADIINARNSYKTEKAGNGIGTSYDVERIRQTRSELFLFMMNSFDNFLSEVDNNMHKGE